MPTIPAHITEGGVTRTVSSDVQIDSSTLTATVEGRAVHVPLSRVGAHWAEQPTAPLTVCFLPHTTLAAAVNTLLRDAWVATQASGAEAALRRELADAAVPSAALIRKLWAAQGSLPVQKRPRANILAAVHAARGWTLYRGAVHRIETLGDISSDDHVAVFTPSTGTLVMYQTEETIIPQYLASRTATGARA